VPVRPRWRRTSGSIGIRSPADGRYFDGTGGVIDQVEDPVVTATS
jgi:hypothetical protein